MTNEQKSIVIVAVLLVFAEILYPPYNLFVVAPASDPPGWQLVHSGRTWISHMGAANEMVDGRSAFVYRKVHLGKIVFHIFGILVLAVAALLIFESKRPSETVRYP